MAGWICAFEAEGKSLWRRQLKGGVWASPAVDPESDRLFAGTLSGWVYALDTSSGAIQWRREIPTKSDPRILSDLLYLPKQKRIVLSSWGGRFHALAALDGAGQYSWEAGISAGAAASADASGVIYCLRAVWEQGIQLVRVSSKGQETILHRQAATDRPARRLIVAAAPVLDEVRRRIYFITNTGRAVLLKAWSQEEDKLLWVCPGSNSIQATPAVMEDGTVVFADLAGWVQAVAPDGSSRYRYASGSEYLLAGPVCEAGHTVIVGDPVGQLHVINKEGLGRVVFEAPRAFQARPSFDRMGNLHVPCTNRRVYVFGNKAV
jgi:outer membrane protein assembly factor BamB